MGNSADAIVFFGIHFEEGAEGEWAWVEEPEKYGETWENFYADKVHKISPPEVPWEEDEELYSSYWDEVRRVERLSPCVIGTHSSGECPMYYVALARTVESASWDEPAELGLSSLEVSDSELQQLKEFCEVMGLQWAEPKWYLASYWG